ncbi:biotin/lipoyl-binding protein [bacterium 210820-DFI.6.37]|nr:biotin/lipoyl-binding protein [bacterium 210820-DFI.6.37]
MDLAAEKTNRRNRLKAVSHKIVGTGKRIFGNFKKLPKKRKIIVVIVIFVVLALIGGSIFVFAGKGVNIQTTQTATATKGTISNTIVGTGNLESGSSKDIEVPSGITIEEVLVEEGDKVEKGDTLATVDRVSLLTALSQTQEQIAELDSEINDKKGDTESAVVTAGVSGRVKRVYAGKGDSVLESMAENGALMLLSVDGTMAVSIKNADELSAGDSVRVVLSDNKTKKAGTVESVTDGTAIITLTDNGTELDEKVTVRKNGSAIGSGKLYIHSQLAVVAAGGTVKSVKVSENQYVSAGETLYTLKDLPASAEYQQLVAQRQELSEIFSALVEIAQNNTITASESGTIENVNVSSGSSGSASAGTDGTGASASSMSALSKSGTAKISAGTAAKISTADAVYCGTNMKSSAAAETSGSYSSAAVSLASSDSDSETSASSAVAIDSIQVPITAPVTGNVPQAEIKETDSYTGSISWNMKTEKFQAASTYTARVTLTAKEGYAFTQATSAEVKASGTVVSGISIDGTGEGNTMTFTVTFTKTEDKTAAGSSDTDSLKSNASAGSSAQSGSDISGSKSAASGSGISGGSTASSSSSAGASSGSTASTESSSEAGSSSDIDTVAAFTFCSAEELVLPISVDEQDILNVEKGQEAKVTFDAIEGETFTGEITRVSGAATVSGGVAKYSVDVTLEATDSMLVGMNGSATVTISSKEDIILIPLNALQESGDRTFVYTEEDGDGNLSGEVEVETGLSDDENVEIVSGLSEGETVYYTRSGALSSGLSNSLTPEAGGLGGGFGDSQNGGGMPGGGDGGEKGGTPPDGK